MSPVAKVMVVLAVLLFAGYVLYGTMSGGRVSCEVCVEFDGETVCRRGAGPTEAEARAAAQESACGGQAQGMSEVIACRNAEPVSVGCQAG